MLPMPGQKPARLPLAEVEVSRAMDEEVQNRMKQPYFDIMVQNNTSAAARDNPEPLLLVKRDPHQVRPLEDTGLVCTRTEQGLSIGLNDPANADKYEFKHVQIDSPHRLCLPCRDAFKYYCRYKKDTPSTVDADSWSNSVILHHNLASLLASTTIDKCQVCLPIGHFMLSKYPSAMQEENLRRIRIEMCWQSSKTVIKDRIYYAMVNCTKEKEFWNFNHIYRMDVWSTEEHSKSFVSPVAVDDVYPYSLNSRTAQDLAKHWLKRCLGGGEGHHVRCNTKTGAYRPTRLLSVEEAKSTGKLRLVVSSSCSTVSDDYISLSHCWGQSKHPILTTQNFEERCEVGIDVSVLPKTFQDAVEVTRWFNVKWLWVDCLCILQDSKEDWLREASLMAQTYRKALLNISADGAYDGNGGLFGERRPTDYLPLSITAPELGHSWHLTPCATFQFAWTHDAPTFSRAWVHRERQISRRILHFTSDQMIWECCGTAGHGFASDRIPGEPLLTHTFDTDNKQHIHGLQQSNSGDASRNWSELQDSWDDVCRNMSRKDLTVLTDMPIVLSSLAEDFAEFLPDQDAYLCGIWKSALPQNLLWESMRNKKTDNLPYITPSWSWMSTSCATTFTARKHGFYAMVHDIAELQHVDIQHKYSNNPYGPLVRGALTLRGYLRQIRFTFRGTSEDDPNFGIDLHVFDDDRIRYVGPHWHNYEGDLFKLNNDNLIEDRTLDCWCFFISTKLSAGRAAPKQEIMALLLQKTKNGAEWRRIGTVQFMDDYALKIRYAVKKSKLMFGKDKIFDKRHATLRAPQAVDWAAWKGQKDEERKNDVRTTDAKPSQPDVKNLYAFDGGLDTKGLERLEAQTIVLV